MCSYYIIFVKYWRRIFLRINVNLKIFNKDTVSYKRKTLWNKFRQGHNIIFFMLTYNFVIKLEHDLKRNAIFINNFLNISDKLLSRLPNVVSGDSSLDQLGDKTVTGTFCELGLRTIDKLTRTSQVPNIITNKSPTI